MNPIEQLAESLRGGNPLRQDVEYDDINLMFLDATRRHCGIASLILAYDHVIEFIREFAERMPKHVHFTEVLIRVKLDGRNNQTSYTAKSIRAPNTLLREKGVHQRIAIVGKKIDGSLKDIILIPFMFGCKWCLTNGLTPEQLHALGEDASYTGGFFNKDGSPKYFLAHEKLSHNIIITTISANTGNQTTTLKTTDDRNNSIELMVVKKKGLYCLQMTTFNDKSTIQVLDVIKQIYVFIRFRPQVFIGDSDEQLTTICDKSSFSAYWDDLVEFVAGELRNFVILEGIDEVKDEPILKAPGESKEEAWRMLFANKEIRAAHELGSPLVGIEHYPQMVVDCVFPSVRSYEKKALLLTKMLTAFILTEHEIIRPSDRDDLGNKSYMNAAQLFKRDLTMNAGERLLEPDKVYEPVVRVEKGDSDVFQTLDQTNIFKAMSEITTLTTPMSKFSKSEEVRSVNCSHFGYKCAVTTPSSDKISLVSHMAVSCCMSRDNNRYAIARLIDTIIGRARLRKGEITLSLNSTPLTTVTSAEYRQIKRTLKTSTRFYDVAIVPEIYRAQSMDGLEEGETRILGYNILCDGGRLHRPLFSIPRLRELLTDQLPTGRELRSCLNKYIHRKPLETLIVDGVVEMLFAAEQTYYTIAESLEAEDIWEHDFAEINPVAMFGAVASCAPMLNHNPGGRAYHEPAMAKSAMNPGGTNMGLLSETSSKLLLTTEQAAVTTLHNSYYSRHYGNGVQAIMLVMMTKSNLEDAVTVHDKYAKTIITQRSKTFEIEVEQNVKVGIPPVIAGNVGKYHAISAETGKPIIGSVLEVGDCLFAMYRIQKADKEGEEDEIVNLSQFVQRGEEGFVSKMVPIVSKQNQQGESTISYRITISFFRALETGDKLATRYSQKGIIGESTEGRQIVRDDNCPISALNPKDDTVENLGEELETIKVNRIVDKTVLPYVCEGKNAGLIPDIVFSPMSLTSRSTPGIIKELQMGNFAVEFRQIVDATSFSVHPDRIDAMTKKLVDAGFPADGYHTFKNPITGETFKAYMGICYVRVLGHTSYEKLKACSQVNCSINKLTRAPKQGGLKGGIREGTMELATFIAHNATETVQELYCRKADMVVAKLCKECGHFNDRSGLFSPEEAETLSAQHAIQQLTNDANDPADRCARCNKHSLRFTELPYGAIRTYYQELVAGNRLAMFPSG